LEETDEFLVMASDGVWSPSIIYIFIQHIHTCMYISTMYRVAKTHRIP